MYFSFAPMNRLGISDSSAESVEEFYDFLAEELSFEIISDPNDYIMDAEWFYDSNFHLNSSGMTVRSVQLLEDIKNLLKISAPTEIPLPEKPEIANGLICCALLVIGLIALAAILIGAGVYADSLNEWYTAWGRYGTALFKTWIIVPFLLSACISAGGVIILWAEYFRED